VYNDPRLVVGIDIGRSKADLTLLHSNGQVLEDHQSFANSLPGFQQIKQHLIAVLQAQGLGGLDLAAEATSYYWLPLFIQLRTDPDLTAYAPRLGLLNAGWVKWFKKSFPPDHKSDKRDPFYVAERIRTLPQPNWWEYDPHWMRLRLLTRLRFHFSHSLAREKNHYQLFLFLAYSAYNRLKPFSDTFGHFSQALLARPDLLEDWRALSMADLTDQLLDFAPQRLKDPDQVAAKLYQALHESYPIPEDLDRPLQSGLRHLGQTIDLLEQQVQELDGEIHTLLEQQPYPEVAWLDSIPGLGQVFASGIAAEIAGIQRFAAPLKRDKKPHTYRRRNARDIEDAVAKFAGLWWPENASGQFQAEERPLSKRGNAYLRYFILSAADRMRLFIPSYARYYRAKYKQTTKHQHKRALVLTGRKALGLFVGLLHHQEFYRPEEV
jgi:transposase